MSTSSRTDVLILGGGMAGTAAAAFVARGGSSVAVCDRRIASEAAPRPEWLTRPGRELLTAVGVDVDKAVLATIGRVRLVDGAVGRETVAELDEPVDVVDVDQLRQATEKAAKKLGAEFHDSTTISACSHGEEQVDLHCEGGGLHSGTLLLLAGGSQSTIGRSGRLERSSDAAEVSHCVEWVAPPPARKRRSTPPEGLTLTLILDSQHAARYGYALSGKSVKVVGMVAADSRDEIRARFPDAAGRWASDGLAPKIDASKGEITTRPVPRGAALEMDTHVGKRALVVGDAGGFVSALSHEGLYPAIASARIAVNVCREAMATDHPQDALADFDRQWRGELVEYLRLPNTDLRFLIPLVFSNPQMAARLAQAFMTGKNI